MKNAINKTVKLIRKWNSKGLAAGVASGAVIISLSGCEMEQYFTKLPSNTTLAPPRAPGRTGGDVGACYIDDYKQPEAQVSRKIDILFVTDTSGSLDEERAGIAAGIEAFVSNLPPDSDYQVGVLLGHAQSQWAGRLFAAGKNPKVLGNRVQGMAMDKIKTYLRANLTQVAGENISDGGEMGLYSLRRSVSGADLAHNQSLGFYRPDAALAIVLIADEQDICYDYPMGITPVPDGDNLEIPAKKKFCTLADGSRITSDRVLRDVKAFMGARPLIVSAITYNETSFIPNSGENEIGYGHNDMVRASSGGILVDMAYGRFYEGLAEIGNMSQTKMNLITDFKLSQSPVVMSSIRVSVDGNAAPFSFQPVTNEVHIASPGSALSRISIDYCVEAPVDTGGLGDGTGNPGI